MQLIVQSKLQSDRCLEVTQSGITLSSDTSGSKSDGESNEDDHYDVAVSTTFPHMRHDIYEDDQNFPNPDLFGNNSRQLSKLKDSPSIVYRQHIFHAEQPKQRDILGQDDRITTYITKCCDEI